MYFYLVFIGITKRYAFTKQTNKRKT